MGGRREGQSRKPRSVVEVEEVSVVDVDVDVEVDSIVVNLFVSFSAFRRIRMLREGTGLSLMLYALLPGGTARRGAELAATTSIFFVSR